jgi:hypothetical protein
MAAKKTSKKIESDFLPRKGDMTNAELSAEMNDLETVIGDIRNVLKSMADDKLATINIDGIQKLPRAKALLREFSGNVWMGLHRARIAAGLPTRLPVSK